MDTRLLIFVLVFITISAVNGEYLGELVGDLSRLAHDVSGKVYIVNENKLRLVEFHYDGKGPDAFFLIGTRDGGVPNPSGAGMKLKDQYGRDLKLAAFVNADLILTLPDGVTVGMIKWFSVWCLQASADFGNIMFPDSVAIPAMVNLGPFLQTQHRVSGTVTVLDTRTIKIENLVYDGQGPDAYFWVGMGSSPDENGYIIPDENGSEGILQEYSGKTITLTLPPGMDTDTIRYFSIWCKRFSVSFGHVMIGNIMAPPYTMHLERYNGKLVGELARNAHDVRGTVYIVDSRHIAINNLHYDGEGPDAFFWIGDSEGEPSSEGMALLDENGGNEVLDMYENADIVLTLPSDVELGDIRWLSIWCKQFTVDFGHIKFPSGYVWDVPQPHAIGRFNSSKVTSGTVTLLDTRRVHIEMMNYNDNAPDTYFYVGNGEEVNGNGMIIPDETGSKEPITRVYMDKTFTLMLPEELSFIDLDWLSVWCEEFTVDMGSIFIPDNLNIPPYVEPKTNCAQMNENFNVAWQIMGDYIHFEFQGVLDPNYGYMSFGISGSSDSFLMANADVFVAYYHSGEMKPMVDDYFINGYSQCSSGSGACPDNMQGGVSNTEDVSGEMVDGVTYIRFRRKLNTGDDKDREYMVNQDTSVVWAMGRVNSDSGLVTKHDQRITETMMLDFGRAPVSDCPVLGQSGPVTERPKDPWHIPMIMGMNSRTTFTASIGPAGPQHKGYTAIRNQNSWGIAWYIDEYLIPELMLKRGVEYTFIIQGGDNPSNSAEYHPFYITDDSVGGYHDMSPQDRRSHRVFAGVELDDDNPQNDRPTADGRYCEYKTTAASNNQDNWDTFEKYFDTLELECDDGSSPGMLKWTPDENTPDLVYYQCYTHRYLGYKIKVVDDFMVAAGVMTSPAMTFTLLLALLTFALKNMM